MHKLRWRTKAMNIVFACALVFGLSAVLVTSQATPAVADPAGTIYGLYPGTTTGTATWSPVQEHSGCYSVKLDKDAAATIGSVYVQFVPVAGKTLDGLDDIIADEWSFWYYLEKLPGPHMELLFEDPDSTGYAEVTIMALQATTNLGGWFKLDVLPTTSRVAAYGLADDEATGFTVGDPTPVLNLGEIEAAINGATGMSDTCANWELTRVRMELWEAGTDTARSCYIDDVTIDGDLYDVEPVLLSIEPPIALDVKSSIQEFWVTTNFTPLEATTDYNWSIEPGVNLSAGDIAIISGGDGDPYIQVRSMDPGDGHIFCQLVPDLLGTPGDPCGDEVHAEKKWGVIDYTELDLDPLASGIQSRIEARAGTEEEPDYENFRDTIYAWFYWGETGIQVHTAGHAVVHWWLFDKDALIADGLLDDLEALVGCATYDPPPADSVIEEIQAIYAGNAAGLTYFTEVDGAGNITGAKTKYGPDGDRATQDAWPADPNIDATFYDFTDTTPTYLKTMTIDDAVATTTNPRGTVEVEVANIGVEEIVIITLTEYPQNYSGENPVCVEKGEKEYKELPEEVQVKIPQVAWAGEKIVLEKHWGAAMVGNKVTFQIDQGSIGTLSDIDGSSSGQQVVTAVGSDGVARCILETEYEGQAEVKCVLYDYDGLIVIGNHDFPVFFLKLESVEAIGSYPRVDVETDVDFGIQVKGWFITNCTELAVDPLTGEVRAEKPVDVDGDGTIDQYLPRGRWVLPDDWPRLAGIYETRRHWDLMDNATDLIDSTSPLGPFNTNVVTTDPPNVAEKNVVGPFNTTQPVAIDPDDELLKWVATASVVGDGTLTLPADLRNTVVPNGILEWQDCPMPAAYTEFTVSGTILSEAPKTGVAGYFTGTTPNFIYEWPFYSYEIPSSRFIPIGGVPEGYRWNSWGWTVAGPETGTADGPYEFWTDLGVSTLTTKLEVYTDNNGRAYVTMDARATTGTADISAIVDYPYQRKHTAIKSATTVQTWGEVAPDTCTWSFTDAGFFPRHLPDSYTGEVVLADLVLANIPAQIQGVWYYDEGAAAWIFWIPGVGGDLLVLEGGLVADYNVAVIGACDWVIPLP